MGVVSNNGVARSGRYTKVLSDLGLKLKNDVLVQSGSIDPSVTALDALSGSIYLSHTTNLIYVKGDDGATTNWIAQDQSQWTKENTGFIDHENITVTYSTTARTMVLSRVSGDIEFLLRGRYYSYPSPWTVPTVLGGAIPITAGIDGTAPNYGTWFLKISTDDATFGTISWVKNVPWLFTDLQIGSAYSSASAEFGMREVHAFMPHNCHESDHFTKGTYLREAITMTAGTAFTTGTTANASVATTASNCPGIEGGTLSDEDLDTALAAWPQAVYGGATNDTYASGTYTTAYRNGASGVITFNTAAQLPYIVAGGGVGIIQKNLITAGSGALSNVTENSYVNVLVMALPVTADAASQAFRYIFLAGQQEYTTLAAAQVADPRSWDFGDLVGQIPEGVAVQMYSYQYNASPPSQTPATVLGRAWLAALPVTFTGSRNSLIGVTGVSPSDHQTLSNRGTVTAGIYHPASGIECAFTAGATTILDTEITVQAALEKLGLYATSLIGGLVSATTQTFAGAKTFAALATFSLGLAISTGGTAGLGKVIYTTTTGINVNNGAAVFNDAGVATLGLATSANWHTFKGLGAVEGSLPASQCAVQSDAAVGIGVGPGLKFRGQYNTAAAYAGVAQISAVKADATYDTAGHYGWNLDFYTLTQAGSYLKIASGGSDGAWTFPVSVSTPLAAITSAAGAPLITLVPGYADAGTRTWAITTDYDAYGDLTIRRSTNKGGDPIAAGATYAKCTAGAWTLGPTTGATFQAYTGSGGATFGYDTTSTYLSILPGDAGGTVVLKFGATSGAAPGLQFKNDASAVVASVTDPGAWTLGAAASTAFNLNINGGATSTNGFRATGPLSGYTANSIAINHDGTDSRMECFGPNTTTLGTYKMYLQSSNATATAILAQSCTAAGAWTLGQTASNSVSHVIQNTMATADADYVLTLLKKTGGDSTSNYFLQCKTDTNAAGYLWNNSGGTFELVSVSDEALKTNIRPIQQSSLARIRDTEFSQYDWKTGTCSDVIGVIAQRFAKTFPRSISTDPDTGLLGVGFGAEYHATVGHAIQELAAENDALKARIKTLEERIAA